MHPILISFDIARAKHAPYPHFLRYRPCSLLDGLQTIVDNPTGIVNMLGESIPKTGTFFVTLVMLRCEIGEEADLILDTYFFCRTIPHRKKLPT